jgi:glutamate N-acetyltransferase/amino-acid N-acetyltransferase
MYTVIEGGVTAAKGYQAGGIACGIKKRKKDLAMIYSRTPCTFAGSFTTNLVKAAPVLWDQQVVKTSETVHCILINSGNANAATGERGLRDAEAAAALVADRFGIRTKQTLVCSTGVIGVPLPMETIGNGIDSIVKTLDATNEAALNAAEAILTTDTFTKQVAVELLVDRKPVRIGGMAKGSGMIHPNMATMLSFITTDARISKADLQALLGSSIEDTYNMISVDGDTSTNDTVLVLANGEADNDVLSPFHPDWSSFVQAFDHVNAELAKLIVKDGEGAQKFIEMTVTGAKDKQTARVLARSVVSSNLVKTAFFGSDANWGRIFCAMGYSGARFTLKHTDLFFASEKGELQVLKDGEPLPFDEREAKRILSEPVIRCTAVLKDGEASATAWGCDLSYEYVRINGDYRS